MPSTSWSIASGWSPAGLWSCCRRKGLFGNVTGTSRIRREKPQILTDERTALTVLAGLGADGAERPDPGRHRGVRRRPEPAQGEPGRGRVLRRRRQNPPARVRAACRKRAAEDGAEPRLSPDRRSRRVRPCSAGIGFWLAKAQRAYSSAAR